MVIVFIDNEQNAYYTNIMNRLNREKRRMILNLLVEGSSMRSASRLVDVSINTVTKLLVSAGHACDKFHNKKVRDITAKKVQCDEIWSFCYAKSSRVKTAINAPEKAGSVWTWTALDPDTKLLISFLVGKRDADTALEFMVDIKARLANRVNLVTDGYPHYLEAVPMAFARDVDYGRLVKIYGKTSDDGRERYVGADRTKEIGNPKTEDISTSHVERMNLNIRMATRRFTRATNAFSKRIENHIHALSLYFVYYNFCRLHQTLDVTPAMEAGLTDTLHDIDFIIDLIDKDALKPAPRGPYRNKRISN